MALRKSHRADLRRPVPLLVQTGLIAALLLLIAAFRADLRHARPVIEPAQEQDVIDVDDIPVTQHVVKPPPPPRPPTPVEVTDKVKLPDDMPDFSSDLSVSVSLPAGPPPASPPAATSPVIEPDERIFVIVEEEPRLLPSDHEGMRRLQQSINYPEIAKRAGVEGRVIVQFVVDEQGNVRDPFVVRGIGAGCDEEAVRAVRQLKFTPGKQRGKSVKVQMTLPITFRLK